MLHIHLLMGPTLSGKSTIENQLVQLGIRKLLTTTDRPMRKGEASGIDYYFVNPQQVQHDLKTGYAAAPRTYHVANGQNWTYYLWLTPDRLQHLAKTNDQVSLVLDYQGFLDLNQYLQDHHLTDQITIHGWYLNIDLKTRLHRYLDGDRQVEDPKEVIRRLYDDEFHAFTDLNDPQKRQQLGITEIHNVFDMLPILRQIDQSHQTGPHRLFYDDQVNDNLKERRE